MTDRRDDRNTIVDTGHAPSPIDRSLTVKAPLTFDVSAFHRGECFKRPTNNPDD